MRRLAPLALATFFACSDSVLDKSGTREPDGGGPADGSADGRDGDDTPADGVSAPGDGEDGPSTPTDDAGADGAQDAGPPPAQGFVHPGVLVNGAMLAHVKAQLAAGREPWKSALAAARASNYGRLDYTAHPRAVVECGSYSMPDIGCSDEKNDVLAAYTHALLWYHTGDAQHAEKAIAIMNGWSAVITDHTNSNGPLQAAWVAEVWPRAAEIIRHTYDGWAEEDVARFSTMLRDVYLPPIQDGSGSNGNWELSMIEAILNMAVFLDDAPLFDHAVAMWRERVPAYVYLESDGPTPVPPPRGNKTGEALIGFWYNQRTFVNGLAQETCRDFGHVQYGLAAILNAAEAARIQGVDLYGEQADRLREALGFHARYINGEAVPSWLCGGNLTDVRADPMWEIGYNHYGVRLGNDMPQTRALTLGQRPSGATHHMAWETLTHGDLGNVGLD